MAVGFGPLRSFLYREVNKAVVCHPVLSVESQLPFLCHNNHWGRHEAAVNYMAIVPGQGGSAS